MNQNAPNWLKDLQSFVDSVPYGELGFVIRRVDRKTVQIDTNAEETLRYVNNDEAVHDISKLLTNLIESSFTGDAHIKLRMKDGNIQIVSIFDTKETKYT